MLFDRRSPSASNFLNGRALKPIHMDTPTSSLDQLMRDHGDALAAADPHMMETVLQFFDRRYLADGDLAMMDIMHATNPDFADSFDVREIIQLIGRSVLLPMHMKKIYIRDVPTWEGGEVEEMIFTLREEPELSAKMHSILGDEFSMIVQHREAEWKALRQWFIDDHHNIAKAVRSQIGVNEAAVSEKEKMHVLLAPFNHDFVKALARNPRDVYSLSPREFEKLIAALLEDLGWEIELTPQTKDGGKDIIATIPFGPGKLLGIVECKRYSPDHKVGIEIVERFVYTVREKTKASLGMMMTTSFFTQGAWDVAKEHAWQLYLNDYEKVQCLLNNFGTYKKQGNSGLWIFSNP